MPPASKKQKRAEPPPRGSAAGAAAGGRQEPGMAPPPQSAARGLQTGVVKEFLQSIQRRDRLGPDFFNDAEKQQWDEWLESVPADAAHSTDAQRLLPVQMPPKCLPRNTAGRSTDAATSMSQQEIIAYSNATTPDSYIHAMQLRCLRHSCPSMSPALYKRSARRRL